MPDNPSAQPIGGLQMRLVHAGLIIGLVLFAAVSLWLAASAPVTPPSGATLMRAVAWGYLAVLIPVVFWLRRKIGARRSGVDLAEWWRSNFSYAVIIWALAEGGALFGLVMGWQTGSRVLHVGAPLVGLALLLGARPGVLEGTR